MIDPQHFRRLVIRPSLKRIDLWSPAAEQLLLGTAITESGLTWLAQKGGGPALGVFQIEPATHRDIWDNYLAFQPDLAKQVARLASASIGRDDQLIWNLAYATAIARLVYYRRPEPLPDPSDIGGLARYWKAHFNTTAGRGRWEQFVSKAGPVLESV